MHDLNIYGTNLHLKDDGIWYSQSIEPISYPEDGNQACYEVEDNSFWFIHRNKCIETLVKSFPPPKLGPIFDIGGGNGFVTRGLELAGFDSVLVEPGSNGVLNAKRRGVKNIVCGTTLSAGFSEGALASVGLFDVVEHIEDDVGFLTSVFELIESDGYLYLTVPAYSWLWSNEDDIAGHYRRYTLSEISELVKAAGFDVEYSSYIFSFLPIPIFFLRSLPFKLRIMPNKTSQERLKKNHKLKKGLFYKAFNALLAIELKFIMSLRCLPFGGSCILVAQKPNLTKA